MRTILKLNWLLAVSVCRDEAVLSANLGRSPSLGSASEVVVKRDFASVAAAYNAVLREATADLVVFAHPDVYLPEAFAASLAEAVAWLDEHDPAWAVLGLVGCRADGTIAGFTYSVGLGSFVGRPFATPIRVRTLDEFVFAVRRSSGLTFDEALPGPQSQLCAPDVCLQAEREGKGVWVIPAFALHNSTGWAYLPLDFWKPYLYMRRKWSSVLPVRVPYAKITRGCLPMVRNSVRALRGGKAGHRSRSRVEDVHALHAQIRESMARLFGFGTESSLGAPALTNPDGGVGRRNFPESS